jgi:hypothetical protein
MTPERTMPGRALRVGVTGARALDMAQLDRLRAQLSNLLDEIGRIGVRAGGTPLRLELYSPLAEGADRLVATLALERGYTLVCPLPFSAGEYEHDFATPESREAFRALLARAGDRVLELDGGRGDDEARSYEAVGRLIVRNCDIMIAVWNDRSSNRRGGTADIVRYSASFGPPVIRVHATDSAEPPRWIEEAADLRRGAEARRFDHLLDAYLARLLGPPLPSTRSGSHSMLHATGHHTRRLWYVVRRRLRGRPPESPLDEFARERPRGTWGPWRMHGWFMRFVSGRSPPWTPPRLPADPVAARWFARYQPANDRAGEYAARYRSSYVWAFILAAIALAGAAVALAFPAAWAVKTTAVTIELMTLLLIFVLVVSDGLIGWQRRAIEYRLLAELCRKQQTLAPLGWAVPRAGAWANAEWPPFAQAPAVPRPPDVPHPPAGHAHEHHVKDEDPSSWVAWLFSAWLRDTPLATGALDASRVAAARDAALRDLIDDQIAYHTTRYEQSHRAGRRLVIAGETFFIVVLLIVALKLWMLLFAHAVEPDRLEDWLVALGLAGAILPALSAAFVGIRAYAELELLADQSQAMLTTMTHARGQLEKLDCTAPLASQALGSALASVVTIMMEDLQGWARLFRAKVVEA